MPEVTISEFASDVGATVKRIQEQLVEAGLPNKKAEEVITDSEKSILLDFLRKKHGKGEKSEPRKITLRRKTVSELQVPVATQGRAKPRSKTVNIEFRKRRTYAKRGDVAETLKQEKATKIVEEQLAADLVHKQKITDAELNTSEVQNDPEVEEISTIEKEPIFDETVKIKSVEVKTNKQANDEVVTEEQSNKIIPEIVTPVVAKRPTVKEVVKPSNKEKARKEKARHGRQELHVASKGSGRRRKKARHTPVIHQSGDNQHGFEKPTVPIVKEIEIPESITLAELAQRMSVKGSEVVKVMMGLGTMATINQTIDQDTAGIVVEEMGHKSKFQNDNALEEEMIQAAQQDGNQITRAPISQ